MALCPTLNTAAKQYVDFDARNAEHLKAFEMLCLGDKLGNIRQHPELRFTLEVNFPDVRSMMFHKVGRSHIADYAAGAKQTLHLASKR